MTTLSALGVSALGLSAGLVVGVAATAHAASSPAVFVTPSTVQPGQSISVVGTGFPDLIQVVAQVCGDEALQESADCAVSSSQETSTTSDGRFELSMSAELPPVPCPCVVLITSEHLGSTPMAPITLVGAPTAPITQSAAPSVQKPLEILSVGLSGWGPWTSLFGASPRRTLLMRVHNPNDAPYEDPPLVLRLGRSGTEGSVISTQPVGAFSALQTRTISVPVTMAPFTIGSAQVSGSLGFAGYSTKFSVRSTVVPWGLVAALLVLAQLILLRLRNRARRRLARSAASAVQGGLVSSPDPDSLPASAPEHSVRNLRRLEPLEVAELAAAMGASHLKDSPVLRELLERVRRMRALGDPQGDTLMLGVVHVVGGPEMKKDGLSEVMTRLHAFMRSEDELMPMDRATIAMLGRVPASTLASDNPEPDLVPVGASSVSGPAPRVASRLADAASGAMDPGSNAVGSTAVVVAVAPGTDAETEEIVGQAVGWLARCAGGAENPQS